MREYLLKQNDKLILYGDKDFKEYSSTLLDILSYEIKNISRFFKYELDKPIKIELFNNHDEYLAHISNFFTPSQYSVSCYYENTIYCFHEAKELKNIGILIAKLIHELSHFIYKEKYQSNYERIIWLDEGLAQYLSGEKIKLEKDFNLFRNWYIDYIIRRDKEIPKINYLSKHGNKYGEFIDNETNKYNGYNFSYLLIRYLIDTKKPILNIIDNIDAIKDLENHIIEDCLNYYNDLFHINDIKSDFYMVNTPEELIDYMTKYIIYGYVDDSDDIHIDTLKYFRTNYHTSSLDKIISSQVGTCIEQAKLIKYFFDIHKIPNKLFVNRYYEKDLNKEDKVRMHCFVVYFYDNQWCYIEQTNRMKRGIYKFDTLESAINMAINNTDNDSNYVLTEIPEIKDNLTFQEFNNYVNSFDKNKKM